ncbi:MAG: hypothetical protein JO279_17005 [Verrucomicrobia bacterium]|nr:hypothetical protein [Verrucomicrobiota bacterium]
MAIGDTIYIDVLLGLFSCKLPFRKRSTRSEGSDGKLKLVRFDHFTEKTGALAQVGERSVLYDLPTFNNQDPVAVLDRG